MDDEKILPIEEMVAWEEFTDRVEILRRLDNWVKNIQRMGSWSTAIISPRRMGKTVLLDRLVNTVFFKPGYRVAPFYLRMKREDITLRKFLLKYATTFFRQYIAYCHQDPMLYKSEHTELEELSDIPSDHKAVGLAKEYIRTFLRRYQRNTHDDARNHWDAFICIPEHLASHSGTRVAVIIDEFQDMRFYVHDTDEEALERIMEKRSRDPDSVVGINLPATYDRQAQSRKAPMLVSGSAVTLIFKVVMGGALGGRFDFTYLKPMSVPDGAALLQTLLGLYAPGTAVTPEGALYASAQTSGHPYYLYCLATSKCEEKAFGRKDAADEVIRYEIEEGKIYGFWQTHFRDNRKQINADSDEELGKKIIYYFTKYNDRPVEIGEIAGKLGVPKKRVEEKIERLYLADLVYRTKARYYTFNDICLMRFIRFVFGKDLEGIDETDLSERNLFNTLKGRFLEIVVQVTMMKFDHEKIDGKFFGRSGEVQVPLFRYVDTKYAKGSKTRQYQIDIWGRELPDRVWICECKYTKAPMSISDVTKLEKAAEVMKREAAEEERTVPEIQMWLVSTGGFTKEVLEYVKDRPEIYFSDYEGINGIFHAFGGNYRIPLFKEAEICKTPTSPGSGISGDESV